MRMHAGSVKCLPSMTPNAVTVAVATNADAPVEIAIPVPSIAPEEPVARRDAAIRAATVPAAVSCVMTVNKLRTLLV